MDLRRRPFAWLVPSLVALAAAPALSAVLASVLALSGLAAGCSKSSSPTEPQSLASLSGYVRLCGFDTLSTLLVTDSKGMQGATSLGPNGSYSFPAVFAAGPYTMTITRSAMSQKTLNVGGTDALKTGANTYYWTSVECPTLTIYIDTATCGPFNGPVPGTVTLSSTGWQSSTISLVPGAPVTTNLPDTGDYHILFIATDMNGGHLWWVRTQTVASVSNVSLPLDCTIGPGYVRGGGLPPMFVR